MASSGHVAFYPAFAQIEGRGVDDGHRNVCSDILNEGEFSSTPLEDLITMRLCPAFLVPQVRCRPRYVTRYPRYSGFVSVEVSQVLRYRLYWIIVGSLCTPLLQ